MVMVNPNPKDQPQGDPYFQLAQHIEKVSYQVGQLASIVEQQMQHNIRAANQQVTTTNYSGDIRFEFPVFVMRVDNSANSSEFTVEAVSGQRYTIGANAQEYIYPLGGNVFKVLSGQPSATVKLQGIDTLIGGFLR